MISAFERSSEDRSCRLWSWIMKRLDRKLIGPVYIFSVHRDLGLLTIYCYFRNCVNMETGTSSQNWSPVEAIEILAKRDKCLSIYTQYPGTRRWSELKFKTLALTRQNLQKRKQKETTFVGMLFICDQNLFSFDRQIINNFSTILLTE